ncbi:hypothetical protein HDU93_007517 [Gonapodya sp. JEL0774]|nr:hypothetical protein HDU93_007517 [Gonapodya sp. JEL0774]
MDNFAQLEVTGARRPQFLPDERVLREAPFTAIFDGNTKPQELSSGTAYVTNMRLLWVSDSNPPTSRFHALALDLSNVRSFDKGGKSLRNITSSPRIRIYLPGSRAREMVSAPVRPLVPQPLPPEVVVTTWVCLVCGHAENTSVDPGVCEECGVERVDVDEPSPTSATASNSQSTTNLSITLDEDDDVPEAAQKACPSCTYLNLPAADTCEICGSPLRPLIPRPRSPGGTKAAAIGPSISDRPASRQAYSLGMTGPSYSLPTKTSTALEHSGKQAFVQFAFRAPPNTKKELFNKSEQGLRDEFLVKLADAVAGRAWEAREQANRARKEAEERRKKDEEQRKQANQVALSQLAGIGQLVARQEQRAYEIQTLFTGAFSGDLEALIGQAKHIVEKARQITARLSESDPSQGGGQESEIFRSYLAELGVVSIESPVTKETAGSLFHSQLAREISDTLDNIFLSPASTAGAPRRTSPRTRPSMLPLTEVYTLITRARPNSLVSPDDLAKSCAMMDHLGLPYIMRKFRSGLLCLCERGLSDDQIAGRVAKVCKEFSDATVQRALSDTETGGFPVAGIGPYGVGATVVEVAQACEVSVLLAGEWMDIAEGKGVVLRDEAWDGERFFLNVLPRTLWSHGK